MRLKIIRSADVAIPDHHVTIPDRLLGLGSGDPAGSKLVESDLRGEHLIDDIRHRPSMTNAEDRTVDSRAAAAIAGASQADLVFRPPGSYKNQIQPFG